MIKKAAKKILPPVAFDFYRLLFKPAQQNTDLLFEGEDSLFKQAMAEVKVYGEYGSGQSTTWVFENLSVPILSVDTSKVWVEKVKSACAHDDRLDLQWVDLGELADWGRPVSYKRRKHFIDYISSVWQRDRLPNVVLIDGRFRVACFLYSLLHAEIGTYIVFDDYVFREHYHLIEEFLAPLEKNNRQALFQVVEGIDKAAISETLDRFIYVID